MKSPKQKPQGIKERLLRKPIVPAKITSLEYALDGENVVFRFNKTQTLTLPQSVIMDIHSKIVADEGAREG